MSHYRMFGAGVVVCLLFGGTGLKSQSPARADFNAFLDTVQQVYCAPNGLTVQGMRKDMPSVLAAFFGHALRQQGASVNQDASLNPWLTDLQNQVRSYLSESVRMYGSSPLYSGQSGGPPITADTLWAGVVMGMEGESDQMISGIYHVAPGSVPSVLGPARAGSPGSRPGQAPTAPQFPSNNPPGGFAPNLPPVQTPAMPPLPSSYPPIGGTPSLPPVDTPAMPQLPNPIATPAQPARPASAGTPAQPAARRPGVDCVAQSCPNCTSNQEIILATAHAAIWCERCVLRMAPDIARCQGMPPPSTVWNSGGKDYCVYPSEPYPKPGKNIIQNCDTPNPNYARPIFGPETQSACQAYVDKNK